MESADVENVPAGKAEALAENASENAPDELEGSPGKPADAGAADFIELPEIETGGKGTGKRGPDRVRRKRRGSRQQDAAAAVVTPSTVEENQSEAVEPPPSPAKEKRKTVEEVSQTGIDWSWRRGIVKVRS